MDRIYPIDLERAQLRKSFRGYARKEVDALLKGASESMQLTLQENERLKHEVEHLKVEVDRIRQVESTIKDTLVLAQKSAEDVRHATQRQADAMLEEARQAGLQERSSAQKELGELRWEIEKLRIDRNRFTEEFRSMLERYEREIGPPALLIVEGEASGA
jgi:cell division initiation protein